jgi:ATP-binding cassette subfamily B protein
MTNHELSDTVTWPAARLGEALEALADRSGLLSQSDRAHPRLSWPGSGPAESLTAWIESEAAQLGFEAVPTQVPYGDADLLVRRAAPALMRVAGDSQTRFLALLGGDPPAGSVIVLGPDLAARRMPVEVVRAALCRELESPLLPEVESLLAWAEVPPPRQAKARAAVLRQALSAAHAGGCWMLRPPPGTSLLRQARLAWLPRHLVVFAGALIAQSLLILVWTLVFRAIATGGGGVADGGTVLAWTLLMFAQIPPGLLALWSQGRFVVGAVGLLKQRLLVGALRLDPDAIRHEGVGHLVGRVHESEALESLSLGGGLQTLVSAMQLVSACTVLALGLGGMSHAVLLLAWTGLCAVIIWMYFRYRDRWTGARLDMTHDLVERMVGHRTRLAQQPPESWHEGEDELLARSVDLSRRMDHSAAALTTLTTGGWMLAGVAWLIPAILSGATAAMPEMSGMNHQMESMTHVMGTGLAISLGGIFFARTALQNLAGGLRSLAQAVIAWRNVAPLYHAAAGTRPGRGSAPVPAQPGAPDEEARAGAGGEREGDSPLIETYNLAYRYGPLGRPVLRECSLQIWAGDRVLLEGPSGGGKSTLAAVLTGLRQPESGLLLLHGLDRETLGPEGWREHVATAPQFHENHVLTETFAFNLLMGRGWPPRREDLQAAEAICRELGLGDLLNRMPAGMQQMVGESGWQLSHGERSRLFIARALLQEADLVVLDESFASLDPLTLQQCMQCVLKRAPALLVIAHP